MGPLQQRSWGNDIDPEIDGVKIDARAGACVMLGHMIFPTVNREAEAAYE